MFSDGFSEGKLRDIKGGFPPDSNPYTEDYDYLSDSDLEDGSHSGEEEEELQDDSGSSQPGLGDEGATQTTTPDNPSSCQSLVEITEVQDCDRSSRFPLDFCGFG